MPLVVNTLPPQTVYLQSGWSSQSPPLLQNAPPCLADEHFRNARRVSGNHPSSAAAFKDGLHRVKTQLTFRSSIIAHCLQRTGQPQQSLNTSYVRRVAGDKYPLKFCLQLAKSFCHVDFPPCRHGLEPDRRLGDEIRDVIQISVRTKTVGNPVVWPLWYLAADSQGQVSWAYFTVDEVDSRIPLQRHSNGLHETIAWCDGKYLSDLLPFILPTSNGNQGWAR